VLHPGNQFRFQKCNKRAPHLGGFELKKLLIASASVLALTTASMAADMPADAPVPSVAVDNAWDAFVAVSAGYTWFDNDAFAVDGEEIDDLAAEARSSASYQFANGFGIQSDLVFGHQSLNEDFFGEDGLAVSNTDFAGHAFYRNDSYLFGVFGQYGVTSADLFPLDVDRTYVGGEAQGYFGNFTLYAQGGYQSQDFASAIDEDVNGFFIKGEARYFAGENLKFAVNGGYDKLTVDGLDFDVETFKVGGSVEYRFADNPFSVFANVDYASSEIEDEDFEASEVRLLAGVKLNLGTQTLLERDRAGATLDPIKPSSAPAFFGAPEAP
jgi:hypothetical protein